MAVWAFPTKQLTIVSLACCIGRRCRARRQAAGRPPTRRAAMKNPGMTGWLFALALAVPTVPTSAAESVNLILNWTPTADHSPFYYAKAQGWYEKAGIDLTIETGKGSGGSALKVGSGGSP